MAGTNRNISVRAVGDFSNLSQGLRTAQNEIQSFGDRVKAKFTEIGEIGRGLKDIFEVFKGIGEGIGELAQRAAELDGGMSSLNRTLGASAVGYMQWANSTAKSYGISQMSAVEYGKSIAMLLSDVYTNQSQLAQQTANLMQGGAVIAAKTGKSQQEVYEDLNSALMGHSAAVKSLDINVMENALVHSQAYKQIANGTPWAQLTAEQQQYIRVTELNRQIQEKFGSTIGDGMDARLMLFRMQLDDLQTSLSEAFMPILYKVLPILSTFLSWLDTAINYVAAFFQVLFGYSGIQAGMTAGVNQHAQAVNALGDAYSNAGKKVSTAQSALAGGAAPKVKTSGIGGGGSTTEVGGKKSGTGFTASFDQVHTIPEATNSGAGSGGAGAGGADGGIPDMGNPLDNINNKAKSVSDNLQAFRDKVAGFANGVKAFFEGIGQFINDHKAIILAVLAAIGTALLLIFGPMVIGAMIEGVIGLIGGIGEAFMALSVLLGPLDLVAIAIGILVGVFVYLYQTNKTFHDDVLLLWEGIKKFFQDLGQVFQDIFQGKWGKALDDLKKAWSNLSPILQKIWGDFWVWLQGIWGSIAGWFNDHVIQPVGNFFSGLASTIGRYASNAWNSFISPFVGAYNWFESNVIQPIQRGFSNILNGITSGLGDGIKGVYNTVAGFLNGLLEKWNGIVGSNPITNGLTIDYRLPRLAKGGITNGPMMALIGDNPGGQEVVSPLDKLQGMMATTVANAINTVMAMQNGSNVGGDIILNIDGKQFARIIKPYADLENKRVGTNVRLQSL